MTRVLDRLLTAATVIALGVLLYAAFRPDGVIHRSYGAWIRRRQARQALHRLWPEILQIGGWIGPKSASVVRVEFGDYQCPFCRADQRMLDSLVRENDSLAIVFVNFPLRIHPAAELAAKASLCAQTQGRFDAMHRQLFETEQWQDDHDMMREAVAGGVPDTSAFRTCLTSPITLDRLSHAETIAKQIGVTGTPTFATPSRTWSGGDVPVDFLLR